MRTTKQNLTAKQQEVLLAIQTYIEKHNYPPTVREIGEMVGLSSSSTVHGHLERLKKKGIITYEPSLPRTITIIKPPSQIKQDIG
ncbi:LexA family protein [Thermicanus aegyptius]|uniref:LexA family protein n=1 Tax=Thermicanus aegyptius TaxID=94009 RepID=UPI000587A4C0|nr:winged helix-turn-helix transcriptional regulator [Thermicanus aegyptius]